MSIESDITLSPPTATVVLSGSPESTGFRTPSPEHLPAAIELPAIPLKFLVCVLYYGAVDREHERSVRSLLDSPLVLSHPLEYTGCPYIDMGRSLGATVVLDRPDIGGILFIDHDMVFERVEAEKIILSAQACRGTVGAAYSMRRPGRIIGTVDGSKLGPDKKVVFFDGGECLPAQHLGMGMTAIHRSVFERLVEASELRYRTQQANLAELRGWLQTELECSTHNNARHALDLLEALVPELRWKDLPRLATGISDAPCVPFFSHLQRELPCEQEGIYFGEDVSFCARSHDHSLPVQVDTRARVYHKGSYCYGIEDVGMQVPYFDRLEVLDTPDPQVAPALFSADPTVQGALRSAFPDGTLPDAPFPASLDPLTADAEAHP